MCEPEHLHEPLAEQLRECGSAVGDTPTVCLRTAPRWRPLSGGSRLAPGLNGDWKCDALAGVESDFRARSVLDEAQLVLYRYHAGREG